MIYLDCGSGIAGDMFVGALIDAGADHARIGKALKGVAKTSASNVSRAGVKAVKFHVQFEPDSRRYYDLARTVRSLKLKPRVRRFALRVLKVLGEAESRAHGITLRRVHLHEAVDCVVDSVAAAVALDDLGWIDMDFTSSIVSCGFNAPATMGIISEYGIPVRHVSDRELVTPTGAAILAALNPDYRDMDCSPSGFGAGSMRLKRPNVLGVAESRELVILESNIDDCTPEQISYSMSSLMKAGALDVHTIPCVMKKGRIGFLVRVLSDRPGEHASKIMSETGSLGVRVHPLEYRYELPRSSRTFKLRFGRGYEEVTVKFTPNGFKPEYDDLKRVAEAHGISFKEAGDRVNWKVRKRLG
ncbi:MAG: DUF111 family protein [Candidatus Altiarchaeales archaeon]|nr:DUF111 family protein [Candidatus Altiarchaeales archaeon]MBD3416711.1 DUF111 family protein [Candidatus Altiarchaeales archaeon]